MKKFLIKFKKIVQFLVSIVASREFAFIYCVFGTIAQTAHTYYLLDGISSLDGGWKITQSIILSLFISSSLLYFTAISDSNDKSPAGKRVINAVMLFMWLEIIINLYYYSKHIVIETISKNQQPDYYQLGFGVLIACIIPITIKLYSSQIRAKEWVDMDFSDDGEEKINSSVTTEIFENINLIASRQNTVDKKLDQILMDNESKSNENLDLGTNPKEYIDGQINEAISNNMSKINDEIEKSFNKQTDLFTKQFENKMKLMVSQSIPQK